MNHQMRGIPVVDSAAPLLLKLAVGAKRSMVVESLGDAFPDLKANFKDVQVRFDI